MPRCASREGASPTGCGFLQSLISYLRSVHLSADWVEEDYAVLPDLVQEACSRLGIAPVKDAFATPINRRFTAFWSKSEDAFAQA